MKTLWKAFRDERGIETLEWILIGALIVAVAIAIYPGALQTQLGAAVNTVGSRIQQQASS